MAEEAVLQVAMDAELMDRAERLYQRLGTSFAEAVRIFARRSVEEGAMPFAPHAAAIDIKPDFISTPADAAEKMRAFRELRAMPAIKLPEGFDPDRERMAALREKYGPFD